MFAIIITYGGCILLASMGGGWLPHVVKLTHTRMQLALSLVSGVMLGVATLHLLPHAAQETGDFDGLMWAVLAGLLTMFFVERFFHFHQHSAPADEATDHSHDHGHAGHEHHHGHGHGGKGHHHDHHGPHDLATPEMSWLGAAIGLGLHSVMDGLALAASVRQESIGHPTSLPGIATFLGIVLHKPFDAMAILTLMRAGNWSTNSRQLVNLAFASIVPFSALFFCGATFWWQQTLTAWVGYALAFSAGTFLCIALSDLLPEVQFHGHDRLKLSAAVLLGIALAWGLGRIEGENHGHGPPSPPLPSSDGMQQDKEV